MTVQRSMAHLTAAVILALVPIQAATQGQGSGWSPSRTPDGQPDLQGIWANNSATPMERPEQLGNKAVLTDEELSDLTQRVNEFRDSEKAGDLLGDRLIQQALGNAEFADFDVVTGNYNAFWLVERTLDNRTSFLYNTFKSIMTLNAIDENEKEVDLYWSPEGDRLEFEVNDERYGVFTR